MTHELKSIFQDYLLNRKLEKPSVLATAFALVRSSYRRPSVLMLEEVGFLEQVHGPAELNIITETLEEIAVSILSEILAVIWGQEHISLKCRTSGIRI